MNNKAPLYILIGAVSVGIVAGVLFYNSLKPSKIESEQFLINSTIRAAVCKKIRSEVSRFKESPDTFKRGTLKNIINEARESAKVDLPQLPLERSIQFQDNKNSIISDCRDLVRGWIKIPSNFPEFYEAELKEVGLNSAPSSSFSPSVLNSGSSQTKVALVIGNSSYVSSPLKNPANDADDISELLKNAGFKVTKLKNADIFELRSSIKSFEENLAKYDVGLIFYSGHGIEFKGSNYLIPVDAQLRNEQDIPRQGYDISAFSAKISRASNKTLILILDACRNNPVFSQYRSTKEGLNQMMAPSGTIIAFSAAPGQLASDGNGRNSPYTAALLSQVKLPNKKIEDVLKDTSKKVSDETGGRQIPWYNSSLVGDFYFYK
jgi:hypothetical protein